MKDYVNHFRKISWSVKLFLLIFLIIASLPIHSLTGSNIQSIIADGIYHYTNYNKPLMFITHVLITMLFILAYLTDDAILFGLLLFFNFHDTDRNKDKKDKGKWYI